MALLKDQIRQDNLQVSLLDVDDFVKKNNLVEITNPVIFDASSNPTSDGLLSIQSLVLLKNLELVLLHILA